MKKLKIFLVFVLLIFSIPKIVQAATVDFDIITDTPNYEVTGNNDILTIILKMGDFVRTQEGIPLRLYSSSRIR